MYGGAWGGSIPLLLFITGMIIVTFSGTGGTKAYWAAGWIALAIGIFFARDKFEYCESIIRGVANRYGAVLVILWLFAGVFGQVMIAGGLVEGLLWVGMEANVQGAYFAVVALICTMLFSLVTGSATGTAIAVTPSLYPAGVFLGADPIMLAVAILAGAGFGDNVSPHSDTTIASATTQGAKIKEVVRARMSMVIVAAIITIVIVFLFGGGGEVTYNEITASADPSGLLMLLSFVVLLTAVYLDRHMVEAFIWGILSAILLGVLNGRFTLADIFFIPAESGMTSGVIEDGIASVINLIIFVLIILAVTQIFMEAGAIEKILSFVTDKFAKSARSAELAIIFVTAIISTPISNNTAAILLVGPGFVKKMGEKFNLASSRKAIMMDCSVTSFYFTIPWHSTIVTWYGLLVVASEQFDIPLPSIFTSFLNPYAWALFLVIIVAAITGWKRTYMDSNDEQVKTS